MDEMPQEEMPELYVWMVDVPNPKTMKIERVPLVASAPNAPPMAMASVSLKTALELKAQAQMAANAIRTRVTLYGYGSCEVLGYVEQKNIVTTDGDCDMQMLAALQSKLNPQ